jgi:hypothetical protein
MGTQLTVSVNSEQGNGIYRRSFDGAHNIDEFGIASPGTALAIAFERQGRLVENTKAVTANLVGEFIENAAAHPVIAGNTAGVTVFHHDHDGV